MGRPGLLEDPERADLLQRAVCAALRSGLGVVAACNAAGVDPKTHCAWAARGAKDDLEGKDTVWAEYFRATRRARLDAEAAAVATVLGAAEGSAWTERRVETIQGGERAGETRTVEVTRRDWRASAWWLERSMPDRWGVRAEVAVSAAPVKTWDIPGLALPVPGAAAPALEGGASPDSGAEAPMAEGDVSPDADEG